MADIRNGDVVSNGPLFAEEMCERYLFGELTETDQEQFEAAYFGDDAFFERFLAVKTELLDLYVRGELGEGKRRRMEPHFMATAARQKKIIDSGDFIRSITAIAERKGNSGIVETMSLAQRPQTDSAGLIEKLRGLFTIPRLAATGVLATALIFGVWLVVRQNDSVRVNDEQAVAPQQPQIPGETAPLPESVDETAGPASKEAEIERAERAAPRVPVGRAQPNVGSGKPSPNKQQSPADQNATANPSKPVRGAETFIIADANRSLSDSTRNVITLRPGATRSLSPDTTLRPREGFDSQILLIFNAQKYPVYAAVIETVEGNVVYRANGLAGVEAEPGQMMVYVQIEPVRLKSRDYIVTLFGVPLRGKREIIGEYYFRVEQARPEKQLPQATVTPTPRP